MGKEIKRSVRDSLRLDWDAVCNRYLHLFCQKHDYIYDPTGWVGNEPGTIIEIGDMFVHMDDIRYDIDNDVPEKYFEKWYWKGLDVCEITGEKYMNYPSYCKGAPDPWTEERLEKVKEAKRRVEQTKKVLEKLIDEYKHNGGDETGNF